VLFAADMVVDVPVRRGQITQIVLGDDEQIVGIPISGKGSNCSDETHTWCIAKQGRDLFVKPKSGATSTNLIVVTDRRRHAFLLHPVEGAGLTLMRLTVAAPMVPRPIAVAASPAPHCQGVDRRPLADQTLGPQFRLLSGHRQGLRGHRAGHGVR
jgi:hypothetical protein